MSYIELRSNISIATSSTSLAASSASTSSTLVRGSRIAQVNSCLSRWSCPTSWLESSSPFSFKIRFAISINFIVILHPRVRQRGRAARVRRL